MPHLEPWSGSPEVGIIIKKHLELASVFPIALEAQVIVMRFEPELFDVPTAI
jgi:hypothetical protein